MRKYGSGFYSMADGKIGRDSSLDCLWKLDLWIVVHETVGPAVCRTYLLQVAWSMIVWALLTDYPTSAWPLGSRIGTCNSFDTHF